MGASASTQPQAVFDPPTGDSYLELSVVYADKSIARVDPIVEAVEPKIELVFASDQCQ